MISMRVKLRNKRGSEFIAWDKATLNKAGTRVTFWHEGEKVASFLESQIEEFEYLN